jgi:hypothetical protein
MKHEIDFQEVVEEMSPITADELRRYSTDSKRTLQAKKDREAQAAAKRNRAIPETLVSIALITAATLQLAAHATGV